MCSEASWESLLQSYAYDLPPSSIATRPLERRDGARLMVLARAGGEPQDSAVEAIGNFLAPGDLLVANNSRVMASRLRARRESGGEVEVFLLGTQPQATEALLRPARRLQVGEVLTCGGGQVEILAKPDDEGVARVRTTPVPLELMAQWGEIPLPPYLGRDAEEADATRYQTVFSGPIGSSAAPTAGLHLTHALLARLQAQGIGFATVTLHVGLGTFRPLRVEDVARGQLHQEHWEISQETADQIAATKAAGGRVIAVGTTSARTLEGAYAAHGEVRAGSGDTRLFIRPPYTFGVIDGLLTNFHLPRSSLMMLVAALCGRERLLSAYENARDKGYRFYSYGDAMLLL